MAENTAIEWTDHTFNAWVGCTKVTPACDLCYAETWAKRTGNPELWAGERRRTSPANWRKPQKWNDEALARFGRRARVFCCSLADIFDNQAPAEWRRDVLQLARNTPNLEWQFLTKRPQNILKMIQPGELPSNVALGTTIEDQVRANMNVPHLLAAAKSLKALYAFTSCEPLLAALDLRPWLHIEYGIDWVITGGESGGKARPSNPQWFRDIRDQCRAAAVRYLHKQNGEWASVSEVEGAGRHFTFDDGRTVRRVGKEAAGRSIDSILHNEFPEARIYF